MGLLIPVALGVAGFTGYEWWKKKKAAKAGFNLIHGHLYAVHLSFTGTPIAPADQNQIQQQLNAAAPGFYDVVSAATDGTNKIVSYSFVVTAPDTTVPAAQFSAGFPSTFGTVTVQSLQDMGAQAQTPTTSPAS